MSALPPPTALSRLLAGLAEHLPAQLDVLLAHDRYADEAAALSRLASAAHRASAVEAMSDREATYLHDALHTSWAAIAEVRLPPVCAIAGPSDVWVRDSAVGITLRAVTDGVQDGWEATWTVRGEDRSGPTLEFDVRPDDDPVTVLLSVAGRTPAGRVLLDARHVVTRRTATLIVEQERRLLLIRDQHGRPGAALRVRVGADVHVTDAEGRVPLGRSLDHGRAVDVNSVEILPPQQR